MMADPYTSKQEAEVWLRAVEAALRATPNTLGNRGREAVEAADEVVRAYKQRYPK